MLKIFVKRENVYFFKVEDDICRILSCKGAPSPFVGCFSDFYCKEGKGNKQKLGKIITAYTKTNML